MPSLRVTLSAGLVILVAAGCGSLPVSLNGNQGQPPADVAGIVEATFAAMTVEAGDQPSPISTPGTASQETGSISGSLSYPSEALPAMYITAFQVGTQNYRYVMTIQGQQTYRIDGLTPGAYQVVAYTVGSQSFPAGLAGGYTQAVPCGLSDACADHALITVQVSAGTESSGVNPSDWYLVENAFPAFPGQVGTPEQSGEGTGAISGNLLYPASGLPALRIVAFRTDSGSFYYADTVAGQSTYAIPDLPPGTYHVVAYVRSGDGYAAGAAGGYSQMVPCGLQYGCNDHTLIDVQVTEGNTTTGVDPNDYYADPGTFPANPAP